MEICLVIFSTVCRWCQIQQMQKSNTGLFFNKWAKTKIKNSKKTTWKGDDLSQVSLQAVLGISGLWYTAGEGYVDVVELVPHFVGRGVQQNFYLIPELVGCSSFALGSQDVVVRELGPWVWQRQSEGEDMTWRRSFSDTFKLSVWLYVLINNKHH